MDLTLQGAMVAKGELEELERAEVVVLGMSAFK